MYFYENIHLSPRFCPCTTRCIPPSMSSIVLCLLLSCFTFHLGFVHPLQGIDPSINAFHCPLYVAFLFHLSPRLCPSTAGCSPPPMSSIVLCLLLSCFTFHLGFVHQLQDVALHQCLPLSSGCCFPVSPLTSALSIHCMNVALYQCLPLSSVAFLFQVVPSFLVMSSCHLLLGRPLDLFPLLGCHSAQRWVRLLSFTFAVCAAHLHFCFSVYSIMSIMFF